MLIKMKESKGFTLVELMIVVAIIGILAAVAVPFYQRYIQKSRLTSMVFPGIHSIETNVGTYYSFKNTFPGATTQQASMMADADTECYTVNWGGGGTTLTITIDSAAATRCNALSAIDGERLVIAPRVSLNKIVAWSIGSTTLSTSLGLAGEGE